MDPLTALGLAANIYAFVDAGFKVVKQYNDLGISGRDATRDNTQTHELTDELKRFSSELTNDGPPSLKSLAANCNTLCDELLVLLNKLKIKNPGSRWEHIKVTVKCLWKTSEISSANDKLNSYRSQLTASFLLLLREDQSNFNQRLNAIQNDLRQFSQLQSDQFAELRSDLLKAMQSYGNGTARGNLTEQLSALQNAVVATNLQMSILRQLRFTNVHSREDDIKDSTKGTFMWPVEETHRKDGSSRRVDDARKPFISWLQSGSGVFHISGKAGSGKSTLMKRIWSHPQTREYLEQWAGDRELCYAAFFFWASGNDDQNSLRGLYQSILFAVLKEKPSLIPKVFPGYWNKSLQTSTGAFDDLTRPPVIEEAFIILMKLALGGDYRICLLIDGLDEYRGDLEAHWKLARQLRDWANSANGHVKFCVSSRPHHEFQSTFRTSEQIHLHEINSSDIKRHCQEMFLNEEDFPGLRNPIEPLRSAPSIKYYRECLVQEIVRRADGVFLWAMLVVRIILSEARRHGTQEDLTEKLLELPEGINALYTNMFSSLSAKERKFTNRILLVILTNPFHYEVNALCLKWLNNDGVWDKALAGDGRYTERNAIDDIEYVKEHLDVWTKGLVEISEMKCEDLSEHTILRTRVKLFHKTLTDYLMEREQFYEPRPDHGEASLADLHARLRLAESGSIKNSGIRVSKAILDYAYEILLTKHDAQYQQSTSHLSWSLAEKLARIFPTNLFVQPRQGIPGQHGFSELRKPLDFSEDQMPSPYFAASLGVNNSHVTEEAIKHTTNVLRRPEPHSRNLLLSACYACLTFNRDLAIENFAGLDLVKFLLEKGFSAHEHVRRGNDTQWVTIYKFRPTSVWVILQSILCATTMYRELVRSDATMYRELQRRGIRLMQVWGELLQHEIQDEVLFLSYPKTESEIYPSPRYDSFITLEDMLLPFDLNTKSKALCHLDRHRWPKYETGGQSSRNAPTWVWKWHGTAQITIANKLEKITLDDTILRQKVINTVVSRNEVIHGNDFNYWYFQAW